MPLIRKDKGVSPPPGTVDLASAIADDRWRAAREMAGQADAAGKLAAALATETEPRVREAILTSLSGLPGPAGAEALAPFLRSDDAGVRTAVLDALRAMGPAVGGVLPALLRDQDADVRGLACDLARQIPVVEANALLSELLDDDLEANVCAAAIDVLAEIGDASSVQALTRCAARFADRPFLGFAVRIALDRVATQDSA